MSAPPPSGITDEELANVVTLFRHRLGCAVECEVYTALMRLMSCIDASRLDEDDSADEAVVALLHALQPHWEATSAPIGTKRRVYDHCKWVLSVFRWRLLEQLYLRSSLPFTFGSVGHLNIGAMLHAIELAAMYPRAPVLAITCESGCSKRRVPTETVREILASIDTILAGDFLEDGVQFERFVNLFYIEAIERGVAGLTPGDAAVQVIELLLQTPRAE